MEYVTLGRAAVKVSRLCLGTWNFGRFTPEADSFQIMDRALEAGVNFFDTADIYGLPVYKGYTEEIIGKWLAQGGGRRDKIVLATKLAGNIRPEMVANGGGLSAYSIRRAGEGSLRRMQTDHIDLYQMHHVERATPWEEIWQGFEQLLREGKITYVGSSNFAGWDIVEACLTARQRGLLGLVSEQCHFSLWQRAAEREVIPAAKRYGMAILPYSPLAGSLLAGVLQSRQSPGRRAHPIVDERLAVCRPQIEKWEALCAEIGAHPAVVGLAWHLHHPGVTSVIIGPRTVEQLNQNLEAVNLKLDAEALKKIDAIFPPLEEAPGYYTK